MKKIINGKMYNTDTAECVASFAEDCSINDFKYYEEDLFRKKTGEYFLYGSGNQLSKYRNGVFNKELWKNQDITLVSEERAMKWVEEFCDADTYIQLFGEPEE
jgi:hypothetical protein